MSNAFSSIIGFLAPEFARIKKEAAPYYTSNAFKAIEGFLAPEIREAQRKLNKNKP